MRSTPCYDAEPATCGCQIPGRERISVVVVYDRTTAGRRAMNQLRRLTGFLASAVELQIRLWRLDMLMETADTPVGLGDMAAADLLVLALDEADSLEAPSRNYLQEAIHKLGGQGAAVAILTSATQMAGHFDFVQDAAREAGVDCLFPPAAGLLPDGWDGGVPAGMAV